MTRQDDQQYDPRLATFIAIMSEGTAEDADDMPEAVYLAFEETAARAAGFGMLSKLARCLSLA